MRLLCLLWLFLLTSIIGSAQRIPVVLDTDIGDDIDDALALALVLQSPELDLKAVITVLEAGEKRADLAYRLLELYGRTEIPVGAGAEQTLLGPLRNAVPIQISAMPAGYHMPAEKRQNGIRLLLDTLRQSPQKMTVLAVGPLTNIALALRTEPQIAAKIDRIMLMNGVFFRAGTEYNTFRDAEASAIVYASGLPITTVGLDVTTQCKLNAEQVQRFTQHPSAGAQFLGQLIKAWQNGNSTQYPTLHDPLAVLTLIRPTLVTLVKGKVDVETHGTPGRTQGLTYLQKDPSGPTQVAQEVRSTEAVQLFLERLVPATAGGR